MKPLGLLRVWPMTLLTTSCLLSFFQVHAAPVVTNVRASQRAGSGVVDIYYDVSSGSNALTVTVGISTNSGVAYNVTASALTGDLGSNIAPGTGKHVVWTAGTDLAPLYFPNVKVRVTVDDANVPTGMVLIPAGSFTMGDSLDGHTNALPLHTVYVSAIYMDKYDVTKALRDSVYQWATNHGYNFSSTGSGKAANNPVQTIYWYDCVKWCNARSEKEGKTPAYYMSAAQTSAYRTGQVNVVNSWVNWAAGYRLPTEAEWEKAARGGLSGQRFPWGNTISESQANYYSSSTYPYDLSNTGYNPVYNDGIFPYTSPVGSFAANGYGLYDMAGNVWQWCWDWSYYYGSASQTDPLGPISGSGRVIRGGSWYASTTGCGSAYRYANIPTDGPNSLGFRSVLPPGQ